jgi:NAD(P)-dependent dehydrogenase (short-subunit alcohol dehydrogenase family)
MSGNSTDSLCKLSSRVLIKGVCPFSVALFARIVWFLLSSSPTPSIPCKDRAKKVVVITGCDTGFGCQTAQVLQAQGFQVVAGCLTEEGVALHAGKVSLSLRCDVTSSESIAAFSNAIESFVSQHEGLKVWALINNAGIGIGGNLDWLPMDVTRRVMEVNFFGVVAVTQALLPLLKKCKHSRIINLSSLAGLLGSQMMSAYCGKQRLKIMLIEIII